MVNNPVQLTRITSGRRNVVLPDGTTETTDRVGKRFTAKDGILASQTFGAISNGHMDLLEVDDLAGIAAVITSLGTNQCLAYGVTDHNSIKLTTVTQWEKRCKPRDALPRSNETMHWPAGRAVLMLDYDPPKDAVALSRSELVRLVRGLHRELAAADLLHWYSTSSYVAADNVNTGARGQRLYFIVDDGSQIDKLGAAIDLLVWAQNLGRIEISSSGSLLQRGLFDTSVWQPSRIDYIAGALLSDGVSQDRGLPGLLRGFRGGDLITGNMMTTPDEITRLAAVNIASARSSKNAESEAVSKVWMRVQIDRLIAKGVDPIGAAVSVDAAKKTQTLTGDFELIVCTPDGTATVSAKDVLNRPNAFNGLKTLDPLEPDYDGGRWVGMIFANESGVRLHSKAHGGATYWLREKAPVIRELKKQSTLTTREIVQLRAALPWVSQDERTVTRVAQALGALDRCMLAGQAREYWEWYLTGSVADPSLFDAYTGQDFAGNSVAFIRFLSWQGALLVMRELEAVIRTPQDDETYELAVAYLTAQNKLPEAVTYAVAVNNSEGSGHE